MPAVPAPRTTTQQAMRAAIFIVGALLLFNVFFLVVSGLYYGDHPNEAAAAMHVREAFGLMTGVVALATFGAALAPRIIGHALAAAQGLALLVGGYFALANDMPFVLGLAQLVLGVLLPVLTYASWRHSRGAWAFLISTLVVLAIVDFFGAPKVRVVLHVGIWTAMILPGLQVVTVIALSMVRGEYREGAVLEQPPLQLASIPTGSILLWFASATGFVMILIGRAADVQELTAVGATLAVASGAAERLIWRHQHRQKLARVVPKAPAAKKSKK